MYRASSTPLTGPAVWGSRDLRDGDGRASFELSEEDVENLRARISMESRPSPLAHERRSFSVASLEDSQAYLDWRVHHPCILTHFPDFVSLLRGKRLAVFLDYDGTLTPIVANPEDAVLSEEMRGVVRSLAYQFPTAIISGRGREKVENFVQLKELYYAGSHGMDIAGPPDLLNSQQSRQDTSFQPAAHFRPIIDDVYEELCRRLSTIPGSSVEHNTFCVSAHYRNCPGDCWQQVIQAVEETLASRSDELKITRGRKVMEIRPKVNWHKGTALNHLLDVLGLRAQPDVVAIYIGDDRTDEDAFKVLQEGKQGFGILVSNKVKETAATYTVRNTIEVMELLQGLVEWARTQDNGWQATSGDDGGGGGSGGSWRSCMQGLSGQATASAPADEPGQTAGGPAAEAGQTETGTATGSGLATALPTGELGQQQQRWQEWQQQVAAAQLQHQQQHQRQQLGQQPGSAPGASSAEAVRKLVTRQPGPSRP